jgi:YidC/Oxa1 family membrane protein insertase
MGLFEIFAAILAFFYAIVPSYGLAIILLTLSTRIVLLPLSIKQTRSMREMQVIQPQVKALQKKYKGDRQKLNEEMMKLYKEHGVNPLGGCLPLLLQMPVLFGLFYVVRAPLRYLGFVPPEGAPADATHLSNYVPQDVSGFLGRLQDSALASDLHEHAARVHDFLGFRLECSPSAAWGLSTSAITGEACGTGSPIVAALPYLLLLALMGFTTFYQQKQMQAGRGNDPQAQQMQMIGRIMPGFLVVIGFGFPAGVLLYWFASNLWTIVQQRIILKAAPPLVGTAAPATAKAAVGKGGSSKGASVKSTAKGSSAKGSAKGGSAKSSVKSATGNGATGTKSKPHPSSKKKKR